MSEIVGQIVVSALYPASPERLEQQQMEVLEARPEKFRGEDPVGIFQGELQGPPLTPAAKNRL